MNIKEKDLAQMRLACVVFIKELLQVVDNRMKFWPSKSNRKIIFEGNERRSEYLPDYLHYFFHLKKPKLSFFEQSDFPKAEAQKCCELLWNATLIQEKYCDSNGKPNFAAQLYQNTKYLMQIAFKLVQEKKSLRITDKTIEQKINRFLTVWVMGKKSPRADSKIRVTVPLYNIGAQKRSIVLSNETGQKVFFKKFTDKEKTYIWNLAGDDNEDLGITEQEINKSEVCLAIKNSNHGEDDLIRCAITALRLATSGRIFAPCIIYSFVPNTQTSYAPLNDFIPSRISRMQRAFVRQLDDQFVQLSDNALKQAKKYFRLLTNNDLLLWNAFHVALSRYNKSFFRTTPEDEIIDLVIALESLLLGKTSSNELSFKLAIRGLILLNREQRDENIYEFLKGLYDIRSRIVHSGEKFDGEEINNKLSKLKCSSTHEFTEKTRTTTRDIILAGLAEATKFASTDKKPLDKLRDALEKEIIDRCGNLRR